MRNLDKYTTGAVNWKLLATYLTLLKTNIPTEKEAEAYQNDLTKKGKDGYIEEDQFINVRLHNFYPVNI